MKAARWRRLGAVGALCLCAACLPGCGQARAQAAGASPDLSAVHQSGRAALTLSFTGARWYGKPVYRLQNRGRQVLRRVRVLSRSGDAMPILAADGGQHQDGPPRDLSPGNSLWFAGPGLPPLWVTVIWLDAQGHALWQVVNCR